ncbi:MipA/OmpV family protein [Teredinibacter sp. KSP-S5-2]|uniref:MipA/OmpV family protein n=1 Tax=Teredinibacter sp. KSP-S5-2 TaxID=3034506 RepID=UPI0029343F6A|nr:MipA/OmpV family protein [Teredinibacter sp. KSP-S5-2]WNO11157.1 MipA/OmpV family protein [Teredinibacter sp. KSP-S5-2]
MKFLISLILANMLLIPLQSFAMSLEEAQSIIDALNLGGKATEVRKYKRKGTQVYEIEYVLNGEEYEAIVKPDGTLIENYKDDGRTGGGLPVIFGLAASLDTQIYKQQSEEAELIPLIIGNYQRFWFRGTRYGYYAWKNDYFAISPMFKIDPDSGYEVADAEDGSLLYEGLDDTGFGYEGGVQLMLDVKVVEFELNLLTDVANGHGASLAELEISKPYRINNFIVMPSLMLTYREDKVSDYYFGVDAEDARSYRPAYEATNNFDAEFSVVGIWSLNAHWHIVGELGYKYYDSQIEDSPLVETSSQTTGFIGMGYSF